MSDIAAPAPTGWADRARLRLHGVLTRIDLKTRLSLSIGLLLGVVLLLAVYAVLGNSRRSVQGEIDAVMRLASSLLDEHAIPAEATDADLLPVLIGVFEHTRHLCVERVGSVPSVRGCPAAIDDRVPDWFVAHVTTAPREIRPTLVGSDGLPTAVVIHSDPADEILEAWGEARPLLMLIVAIGFLTNAIVVFSVWRALRPIDLIRDALARIGRGELHPGMPKATTPELRTIIDSVVDLGISLERARSDNQRLLRHSLEVQERERRAIARELHDDLGQSLAAMDAEAALLHQKAGVDVPELARRAAAIRSGIASLYEGLHGLLARLRPAGLEEFGLGPALENLVMDWSGRCPQIRFEQHIALDRVPGGPMVQVYLYRIAQEALTNATRHARARRISLLLGLADDGAIELRIIDDGCGLPGGGSATRASSERVGLGLLGMAERAETLGAALSVGANPGGGTCILLRLPLVKGIGEVHPSIAGVT